MNTSFQDLDSTFREDLSLSFGNISGISPLKEGSAEPSGWSDNEEEEEEEEDEDSDLPDI